MKKKKINIIVAVIIIAVIFVGLYFAFGVQQTAFSFDRINVLGEGDKLIITTSVGNEKDNIIVELDKDELNSAIKGEGWEVSRGTRIEIDLISSEEVFPLNKNENEIFYQIGVENVGKYFGLVSTEYLIRKCQDRDVENTFEATLKSGGFLQLPSIYCFYAVPTFTRGQISGTGIFEYDIKISAAGDTEILTEKNQVVSLADGDIKVEFEGSINAPIQVKDVPYDVVWANGRFIHLVSQASISYLGRSATENVMLSCSKNLDVGGKDYDAFINCQVQASREITRSLINRNNEFAPLIVKSINLETITSNTGELRIEVEPTTYPFLKIIVDGDFIGLERLTGEPDIVKCNDDIVTLGGREITGTVQVKNIGTQSGYFIFKGECDNPKINVYGSSRNVAAGATSTIATRITGSSEKTGVTETTTCIILIEDKISGSTNSCSFDVSIEFTDVICTPEALFCSEDNTKVLRCGSFGDEFSVHEECTRTDTCGLTEEGLIDCRTIPLIEIPFDIPDIFDEDENGDDDNGDKECPFGQEWREEIDYPWYEFWKGDKPAGCYTAGWVYFIIVGAFILLIVIIVTIFRRGKKFVISKLGLK